MFSDPLSFGFFHAGPQLWVIVALLIICFWGIVLGLLLRGWRKSRFAFLKRRPGVLYCPECAAVLEPDGERHRCPNCQGKWIAESAVKPVWRPYAKEGGSKIPKPCPKCGAAMATGGFLEKKFTVERCASCAGYWLTRIDWVSFELGL